jgi:hypothetical protein
MGTMDKAREALESAEISLNARDRDGAANHSYFVPLFRSAKVKFPLIAFLLLIQSSVQAAGGASPLPIWFFPSTWYPYVLKNDVATPEKGPGWKTGYVLQGDYNAMFLPGAQWDPSKLGLLVLNISDVKGNPKAKSIADWSNAHRQVKLGLVLGMLTVGPDSHCIGSGGQAFPAKGTPLTASGEGVEFHANYSTPGWNYSQQSMNAIKAWVELGGRPIDVILMDTPLMAGIGKCSFTVAQTVSNLVPMAQQILSYFPKVQFALEEGPASWTNAQWIGYSLEFFHEFPRQVINPVTHAGIPVSYADLDLELSRGDVRKPPTPLYTTNGVTGTVNAAVRSFSAAGVGVAVNINTTPAAGETQAQVIARLNAFMRQAIASGLPFDHISLQPFAVDHYNTWVMNNLPDTSPSALTWLLKQGY